ncbi:MAG: superinfection immunity protein [Desulfobacteraceae bacterium]|nr:superinfection immunity protein [Desulfobacteraceae bacterium]
MGRNQRSVFLINLFLGWTIIVWVIAMKKVHKSRKMRVI